MNTSGLPITQLGSTIKSHMGIAEKYLGKAEEHYKSAGIHLREAKARIASGEYEGKFGEFLLMECNALSSSRAYELIAGIGRSNALFRRAGAAMGRPGPWVEALSGVFVVDGGSLWLMATGRVPLTPVESACQRPGLWVYPDDSTPIPRS